MHLLRIKQTPIQIQYEVEPARLETRNKYEPPEGKVIREQSRLETSSKNTQVKIDTTQARASMGLQSPGAWAREYGNKGRSSAQQAVGEYVQFGNQMQRISDNVTISDIVRNKVLQQQPTTYQTFIPAMGAQLEWEAPQLDMHYNPGSVDFDWQLQKNIMDYVPGRFSLRVTQYPRVTIEYLGSPLYVPRSSDPDYDPPAE